MEWKIKALKAIIAGEGTEVNPVVLAELREQGYTEFVDSPTEIALTDKGNALLVYADSSDYASKRY